MSQQKNDAHTSSASQDSDDAPVEQDEFGWALVDSWPKLRAARIGDRGCIIGVISHNGTGFLKLVLSTPSEMILLSGGFHRIQEILDNFSFYTVEVIEAEGSASYGFHGIRPVNMAGNAGDNSPLHGPEDANAH